MPLDDLQPTSEKNVFYRTEPSRKHGVKLDRQFVIVYKIGGKKYRGVIGWESAGHRISEASDKIDQFRKNFKNGTGPLCLADEQAASVEKREAQKAKEATQAKKNITMAELVDRYDAFVKGKLKSYASTRGHLQRIRDDLGTLPLRELTLERLENWQHSLLTEIRKPRAEDSKPTDPLSPVTVNRYLQTFKAMLTKANEWGLLSERRLRELRKIKLADERHNRRTDFLSREEAERLIEKSDPSIRPVVICALQTGMRKDEILDLKWSNVDLAHRLIHIVRTKTNEPRSLPINNRLLATLKDLPRSISNDHVFLNVETGTRWSDLKSQFRRAVTRAKLEHRKIVFHHLRHTAASWMVMAGTPLLTVAKILGHADIKMVMRYSHLSPDHLGVAMANLDSSAYTLSAVRQEG